MKDIVICTDCMNTRTMPNRRKEFESFLVQHEKIMKNSLEKMAELAGQPESRLSELQQTNFNRKVAEINQELGEMEDKLWYGRHLSLRYDVEHDGKYVDPKIWKGALASATKVEEKYGAENLQLNNFEWGMLNGKISALRWVLGDDWDELYT